MGPRAVHDGYDPAPTMRLAPPVARALRLSIFEGSMWAVYWNVVAGVVVNGLALALGARPFHLAILNALPLLGQVGGLLAARYLQARDARKPLALAAEAASRGVWLLLLLLLVPGVAEGPGRVWFLLGVAAASHVVHFAGAVAWLSWISDLVPEPIRGVYFGVRTAIVGVVGLVGLSLAGHLADQVRAAEGPGRPYLTVLLVLVAGAVLFGGLSWLGLLLQPVRKMRRLSAAGWRVIGRTLTSREGRRIAIAWMALAGSAGVTTGAFMAFFLDRLHMSMTGVVVYGWVALAVSTAVTPLLGRVGDRFGHRNLLLVAWVGVFWQPLLSVMTPDRLPHLLGLMPWTILVDALFAGSFWPAVGVAQTNLVIAYAPSEGRAALFAGLSALAGIAGFLGAVVGGVASDVIGANHAFTFLGLPADDVRFPMILGVLLRTIALATIPRVSEPAHTRPPITSAQAFTVVWRLVAGKPVRPPAR